MNTLRKSLLSVLMATSCLVANAQTKDSVAIRIAESISVFDLQNHLTYLASDQLEGRETGQRGQKMAAAYIADFFAEKSLKPLAYDTASRQFSYLQKFPYTRAKPATRNLFILGKDTLSGNSYYFPGFQGFFRKTSDLAFMGYGIKSENYNDFEGVTSLSGRTVMVFLDEPGYKKRKHLVTKSRKNSEWNYNVGLKIAELEKLNPDAIIFIQEPNREVVFRDVQSRIPVAVVSFEAAASFFKSKRDLECLRDEIEEKRAPQNFLFNGNVEFSYIIDSPDGTSENVAAFLEGTDLKNELVVISAHYDHLGVRNSGIFNGADDNGSGTAAVMEIAEAFSMAKKMGKGPRRSILFILMSGEEKGLVGSEFYSKNPLFPMNQTVVDLNIDMVGRIDSAHAGNENYIYLIGSDMLSKDLHNLSERVNSTYSGLELDYKYNSTTDKNRYYYRSDHYNFAKNGIPVIFYFNGVHADYHKTTDTVDKINFNALRKRTQLVFFTAWEIANRNQKLKVD